MKIDTHGRITIETEHEAQMLHDLCIEIDRTNNFRTPAGEIHPTIRRWLDAMGSTGLSPIDPFLIRGLVACLTWWKGRVEALRPRGRAYDDSM